MTQENFGTRYVAHASAMQAKRRMDEAIDELHKAEAEWMEACRQCDRLDGIIGEGTHVGEITK